MTHTFTPEEANKKLPEVRKVVVEIVMLKKSLDSDVGTDEKKRNKVVNQINSLVSKLQEGGIEMKDLDSGLLDFPAVRYREPVLLCWKLGEEEVLYWHSILDVFRGRKPLKSELAQIR
jgi:hypothetical protein